MSKAVRYAFEEALSGLVRRRVLRELRALLKAKTLASAVSSA